VALINSFGPHILKSFKVLTEAMPAFEAAPA
jgi:hypothetical protein